MFLRTSFIETYAADFFAILPKKVFNYCKALNSKQFQYFLSFGFSNNAVIAGVNILLLLAFIAVLKRVKGSTFHVFE